VVDDHERRRTRVQGRRHAPREAGQDQPLHGPAGGRRGVHHGLRRPDQSGPGQQRAPAGLVPGVEARRVLGHHVDDAGRQLAVRGLGHGLGHGPGGRDVAPAGGDRRHQHLARGAH